MPDFFDRIRIEGDPVADPAAQVRVGRARFTVLTDRLVRLEWSPDGTDEDRATYAFPHRRADPPPYDVRDEDPTTVIDTGALVLRYAGDESFGPDNLSVELTGVVRATWRPGDVDRYNLGGARRTVDECRGDAALEPGLVSRSGWAVHDDGAGVVFGPDGWVQTRADRPGAQDWYFFGYGHDYAAAIGDYTRFGGSVPLVPRWLLGTWWSRFHPYSDADLRELVGEFVTHDLPLDILVLDMDWHSRQSWTGYSWNRDLFPDPPGFLAWLHGRGLRTTLNLHPALGVQPFEDAYPAVAARLGVTDGSTVPFRIADRDFARAYVELLHHPLEDQGVDFWWIDWQQGRTSELAGLDPLPWLNLLHFRDLARRPDRRPVIFSRWGGLGSHRYPIGFSGDSAALWPALRFQPRYTAAGANVGYGWWSHDIGGHFGADEPELYVRWVQFGALSPILRLHSTEDPLADRRPWAFGDAVLDAARSAYRLRYQLIPYLYTAARTAADTGIAMVRPMSWVAPETDSAYVARYQYLLGPDLLAAPVVHPAEPTSGLASVDVWLPDGEWVERSTLETFTGPRWVRLLAGLDDVPQLVRPGAILPLSPVAAATDQQPTDHLVLSVVVGGEATARVYDDDGRSSAYRDGSFAWTTVRSAAPDAATCSVTVDAAEGAADLGPRRYTVRFAGTVQPVSVAVDGAPHDDWRYDAEARTTVVEVARRDLRTPLSVEVRADRALSARGPEHNTVVRTSDLRRLLGQVTGDVRAAVLALPEDSPVRPAALARIGGPSVQVIDHTAPDEAARSLGYVVVAAPEDDTPVRADVVWTLDRGGRPTTSSTGLEVSGDAAVLEAPFAWDGALVPTRWSAEVTVTWGDVVLRHRHDSDVLVPALPRWRAALVEQDWSPAEVRADLLRADPRLDWRDHVADPTGLDFPSLSQPYTLSLREEAEQRDTPVVRALAAARIVLPHHREVAFAYAAGKSVEIHVDGEPLEADVTGHGPSSLYTAQPTLQQTSAVHLTAGDHDVVFTLTKSAEQPAYELYVSAQAVDPTDGTVLLEIGTPPTPA